MKTSPAFLPLLSTIFLVSTYAASSADIYAGVQVIRVPTGSSRAAVAALENLIDALQLSSWSDAPVANSHVDLEVPADKHTAFINGINKILISSGAKKQGFDIEIMHEDLAASIAAEAKGMYDSSARLQAGLVDDSWFSSYHLYDEHLQFLEELVAVFPNNSRIVTSGTSNEGRNITGINIFGDSGPGSRPAVIWHGTVHAREWITTMTTEYLAYQLLTGLANSTEVQALVSSFDFTIFPIVNPDGFVYTQTTQRLWRKNRQPPVSGSTCYGRDINRNWAHAGWNETGGASTSPCNDAFKGLAPADAPETVGLAAYLDERAASPAGAKMYIDWHSYSQLFMTPYGYSCTEVTTDADELNGLAAKFGEIVESVYGTQFTTGPICQTIYKATGSSVDYTYDVSKIKYSFAAELRDIGRYGFVLPADQIRPTGEEIWEGIRFLLANLQ